MILPINIGALGTIAENVRGNIDKLGVHLGVDILFACLLGTAHILQKALDIQ